MSEITIRLTAKKPDNAAGYQQRKAAKAAWQDYNSGVNAVANNWSGMTETQRLNALASVVRDQHQIIKFLVMRIDRFDDPPPEVKKIITG